jgi:hypothetical protein
MLLDKCTVSFSTNMINGQAILSQCNGLALSQLTYENLFYNSRIPIAQQGHVQSVRVAV